MRGGSFLPAYFFSLLIWIVASLPGNELQKVQNYPERAWLRIIFSDPFMHFLVFGLLTLLICRGYYRESRESIPMVKVALLACGYSCLIEIYQGILPWRTFGLDDIGWNTVGVLFFVTPVRVSKAVGFLNPSKMIFTFPSYMC